MEAICNHHHLGSPPYHHSYVLVRSQTSIHKIITASITTAITQEIVQAIESSALLCTAVSSQRCCAPDRQSPRGTVIAVSFPPLPLQQQCNRSPHLPLRASMKYLEPSLGTHLMLR
ncbi:hypothetical protein M0R45_019287 [Rubus argutus]|uniref:Uncharacterized protein n=1 Tax=Rubus argutus TaxID=59490 RepID=A0AAW1X7D6_RUBAR